MPDFGLIGAYWVTRRVDCGVPLNELPLRRTFTLEQGCFLERVPGTPGPTAHPLRALGHLDG